MFGNVGRTLALLRSLRTLPQARLAQRAGIGKSQLSKYENGKELPKLDSLEKVLTALGVGQFEFFYTLHLIDTRASRLGEAPALAPNLPLSGGLAPLSREVQTAFSDITSKLFDLYRRVYEEVVNGACSVNLQYQNEGAHLAPTLETERLRLRSLSSGDLKDYAALYSDPEVLRNLAGAGGQPWDAGRSWRHLAFLLGHWQLAGIGSWAVEHKETRDFLGVVGFSEPEGWPGLELAWILARRWWGFGYATEAVQTALEYAFSQLGKDQVISLISPENQRSIRVAERLGETLQRHLTHHGRELLCYGVDRESYLKGKGNHDQD